MNQITTPHTSVSSYNPRGQTSLTPAGKSSSTSPGLVACFVGVRNRHDVKLSGLNRHLVMEHGEKHESKKEHTFQCKIKHAVHILNNCKHMTVFGCVCGGLPQLIFSQIVDAKRRAPLWKSLSLDLSSSKTLPPFLFCLQHKNANFLNKHVLIYIW